ncbi:MAG: DUF1844 domain-containing protein [Planctomycetes bacterium]|nr:DUF1844 domain-containing protein [Planctomycetota bacterium]
MSDEPVPGKIHVDSDWKAEAQAEKEKLAAEEEAAQDQPVPEPQVADLINMIAMPAAMALGGYRTPEGQTVPPDLTVAKFHIDMLGVLETKTQGNLSEDEAKALAGLLHQLRSQFADVVTRGVAPPPPAPPPADG